MPLTDFDIRLYFSHRRRLQEAGLLLPSRINGGGGEKRTVGGSSSTAPEYYSPNDIRRYSHSLGLQEFIQRLRRLDFVDDRKIQEWTDEGIDTWEKMAVYEQVAVTVVRTDLPLNVSQLEIMDSSSHDAIDERCGVLWLPRPQGGKMRGWFFQVNVIFKSLRMDRRHRNPLTRVPLLSKEVTLIRDTALHADLCVENVFQGDVVDYPALFIELAKYWLLPHAVWAYEEGHQARAVAAMEEALERDAFDVLLVDVTDVNSRDRMQAVVFTPDEQPDWDVEFLRTFDTHVNQQRRGRLWDSEEVFVSLRRLSNDEKRHALEQATIGTRRLPDGVWLIFWLGKGEFRLQTEGVAEEVQELIPQERAEEWEGEGYIEATEEQEDESLYHLLRRPIEELIERGIIHIFPQGTKLQRSYMVRDPMWHLIGNDQEADSASMVLELVNDGRFINFESEAIAVMQFRVVDAENFYNRRFGEDFDIVGSFIPPSRFNIGYRYGREDPNATYDNFRIVQRLNPEEIARMYIHSPSIGLRTMINDGVLTLEVPRGNIVFAKIPTTGDMSHDWHRVRRHYRTIDFNNQVLAIENDVYGFKPTSIPSTHYLWNNVEFAFVNNLFEGLRIRFPDIIIFGIHGTTGGIFSENPWYIPNRPTRLNEIVSGLRMIQEGILETQTH